MPRKPKVVTEADIEAVCRQIGEIICPPCGQPIGAHSRSGKCPTVPKEQCSHRPGRCNHF